MHRFTNSISTVLNSQDKWLKKKKKRTDVAYKTRRRQFAFSSNSIKVK